MFIQLSDKTTTINVNNINYFYANNIPNVIIINFGCNCELPITFERYEYILKWLPDLKIMEAK